MVMKKIKLPLEMADGVAVRTLEELKDNWDLEKVLNHFLTGRLLTWLNDRYYSDISEKISKLDVNTDSLELQKSICDIFGVEYDIDNSINIDDINEKNRRLEIVRQYTDIDIILKNIDKVAFDQEEMACLLDANEQVIYLFNNTFSIPLSVHDKKYVGVGNVEVVIKRKALVDFDSINISFENVTFDHNYNQLLEKSPDNLYKMGSKAEDAGDVEKAFEYYKKVAALNDARGWFKLGWFYSNGICVKEDYEKAMQNYLKAAEMGHTAAMNNIGAAYANGSGVEKNDGKALEWYRKAAEGGYTFASKNIGDMYYYGEGVKRDYNEAFNWYRKSDDISRSCYMLGWMYEFGQGTVKDIDKAQEYYKKAAEGDYYNSTYKWDPTFRLARILFDKYNKQEEAVEVLNKYYDDEKKKQFVKSIDENIDKLSFVFTSSYCVVPSSTYISATGDRDANRQLINEIQQELNKFYSTLQEDTSRNSKNFIDESKEISQVIMLVYKLFGIENSFDISEVDNLIVNSVNYTLNNFSMPRPEEFLSGYELMDKPTNSGSFFNPSYGYAFYYRGSNFIDSVRKELDDKATKILNEVKSFLHEKMKKI